MKNVALAVIITLISWYIGAWIGEISGVNKVSDFGVLFAILSMGSFILHYLVKNNTK